MDGGGVVIGLAEMAEKIWREDERKRAYPSLEIIGHSMEFIFWIGSQDAKGHVKWSRWYSVASIGKFSVAPSARHA